MKKKRLFLLCIPLIGMLASCTSFSLASEGVAYQSVRSASPVAASEIPENAQIIVSHQLNDDGLLDVVVKNNTGQIMVIDRTRSFFRNISGNSIPYYDPTVRTSTNSYTSGQERGVGVNLGSIAGALGVGGAIGQALNGVNVGGSKSSSSTTTNTTYYIDQPQISIAPYGQASMGRTFEMQGIGNTFLDAYIMGSFTAEANEFTPQQSYAACNVCISYSLDNGISFDQVITDIYANTLIVSRVKETGKVNNALREIYTAKGDALDEGWFLLRFKNEQTKNSNGYTSNHEFINYK
ncbi:MAG: hypothetical protein IKR63_08750 [Alloprevotella sp.]|nr:hypothetical protein [Alloprevotella sp.]